MQSCQLFPLTFPFSPLSLSVLVLFLFRGTIWSVITSGRLSPLSSAASMPRRILHIAEEGFFLPIAKEGFSLGWALGLT